MTKEEVIIEIRRLQCDGHSMKSGDFSGKLYREIKRHFGGWKQAKMELGITNNRKPYVKPVKWTDEIIREGLLECHEKGFTIADVYGEYKHAIDSFCRRNGGGGLNNVCKVLGVPKFPIKPRQVDEEKLKWSRDTVVKEIHKLNESGAVMSSHSLKLKGNESLVDAAKRRFGTWNKALEYCGINPVLPTPKSWTKDEVKSQVTNLLAEGFELKRSVLTAQSRGLNNAIYKHYKDFEQLKVDIGVCHVRDRPKPQAAAIPTREQHTGILLSDIRKRYSNGEPLNYSAVKGTGIFDRAKRYFGSWKSAVEAAGFDYEKIKVNTNVAAEVGVELERLFEQLLSELKVPYAKYAHKDFDPDFVLVNNVWIDVKLSEWTAFNNDCKTIERYEPHCSFLNIVYLRGRKSNRMASNKTRLIHIDYYIKQLSRHKRSYYYEKINEMERKLNELEAA